MKLDWENHILASSCEVKEAGHFFLKKKFWANWTERLFEGKKLEKVARVQKYPLQF